LVDPKVRKIKRVLQHIPLDNGADIAGSFGCFVRGPGSRRTGQLLCFNGFSSPNSTNGLPNVLEKSCVCSGIVSRNGLSCNFDPAVDITAIFILQGLGLEAALTTIADFFIALSVWAKLSIAKPVVAAASTRALEAEAELKRIKTGSHRRTEFQGTMGSWNVTVASLFSAVAPALGSG
jgi:hypothetical protein